MLGLRAYKSSKKIGIATAALMLFGVNPAWSMDGGPKGGASKSPSQPVSRPAPGPVKSAPAPARQAPTKSVPSSPAPAPNKPVVSRPAPMPPVKRLPANPVKPIPQPARPVPTTPVKPVPTKPLKEVPARPVPVKPEPSNPVKDSPSYRSREKQETRRSDSRQNDHRETNQDGVRREKSVPVVSVKPDLNQQKHIDSSRQRMRQMNDDREMRERVERERDEFRRRYLADEFARRRRHEEHFNSCNDWYSHYRRHGFRGGYFYHYNPIVDVTINFVNPLWSWFYVDTIDVGCYRTWYGVDYDRYRFETFRYRRIYHPTVEFRQLVIGVSDLDASVQAKFREGMLQLTDLLGQKLANLTSSTVVLNEDDVVVNNYQVLQDKAVVVEGYVDHDGTRFAFKGFVDMRCTKDTMLFVPANAYGEPSSYEIDELNRMNNKILDLGGTIESD